MAEFKDRLRETVDIVYGTDNERSKKNVRQGFLWLVLAFVLLALLLAIIL